MVRIKARSQRVHQIHDIGRACLSWRFDLFAFLLLLQQLLQGILIMILKFVRLERTALGVNDMHCKIEHFFGYFFVGNLVEVRVFFSHFVWVPQRNAEQPLAPRFKCDDAFARREDYFSESNDPLLTNRFANNRGLVGLPGLVLTVT